MGFNSAFKGYYITLAWKSQEKYNSRTVSHLNDNYSLRWPLFRPLSTILGALFYQTPQNLSLVVSVNGPFFTFSTRISKQAHFSQRCSIQATKVVDSFPNTSQTYRSQNSLRLNHVPLVSEVTLRYVCCKPRSRIELWRPCPVLSCPVAISCCAVDFFLFHLSLSQNYFPQLLKQCVWDELGTAQWTTNPDAALHAYYITCTCTKCDGCTLTSQTKWSSSCSNTKHRALS